MPLDAETRHAVKALTAKVVEAINTHAPAEVLDALDYRLRLLEGRRRTTLCDPWEDS